jgi:RNA polymerase sigma-70 factor, ECF subfamily
MNRQKIDKTILQQAANGDHFAFKHIYEVYRENVYSLTYYMLGNENDAYDVSQEIFIKLFTSLGQFKHESEFSTWFYRLSINACLDHLRKENRHRTRYVNQTETDSFADTSTEPLDLLVLRDQINNDIEKAIQTLSPKLRSAMMLRHIDGLSYEDISRILNCSVGTVSSRLNRGYKSLGKALIHLKDEV